MKSPTDMSDPCGGKVPNLPMEPVREEPASWETCRHALYVDERLRVAPLAALLLEHSALIDDDLPVVADVEGPALQRPGGRPLEVDAADVEAAAMAGALEFLGALQPVRGATQM